MLFRLKAEKSPNVFKSKAEKSPNIGHYITVRDKKPQKQIIKSW